MKHSILLSSLLLFFGFLVLRLYDLSAVSIQSDEVHWVARSGEVVKRLSDQNYFFLTSHLGQPGVVPALAMATTQFLGEQTNSHFNLQHGDKWHISRLVSSRVACVFISSLVCFVLILLGSQIFGFSTAFIGTVLLLLSPNHIALSKIAHLDAVMTVAVMGSIFYFFKSLIADKLLNSILSGVFWGLAIATKPTAGALIVSYVVFLLFYAVIKKINFLSLLFDYRNIVLLITGHVVFSILYTRMWIHESDYLLRLGIISPFADIVYSTGLNNSFFISALVVCLLILAGFSMRRINFEQLSGYLLVFAFMFAALGLFPQALEGIIRYWTWASGLTRIGHDSFGNNWKPIQGGYFHILFEQLPPLIILGSILGGFYSFISVFQKKNFKDIFLLGLVSIPLVWILILSASSKQTFRYLLPVMPCLYILSGYGFYCLFENLSFLARAKFRAIGFASLVLIQGISGFWYHPDQLLYRNMFSSPIKTSLEKGEIHTIAGLNEAARFFHEHASDVKEQSERFLYVQGDQKATKMTFFNKYPKENVGLLRPPDSMMWGHYFLQFHNLDKVIYGERDSENLGEPLFSYKVENAEMMTLYKLRTPDFHHPVYYDILKLNRVQGNTFLLPEELKRGYELPASLSNSVIAIKKGRSKKGYVFSNADPFLSAGEYELIVYIRDIDKQNIEDLAESTPVLKLTLGHTCERVIRKQELSREQFLPISFSCTLNSGFHSFSAYWFRTEDLLIGGGIIKKLS